MSKHLPSKVSAAAGAVISYAPWKIGFFSKKEMYKTFELMNRNGTSPFLRPYFTILNYKSESNEVEIRMKPIFRNSFA